jgi:exonuclease III
VRIATWNVNSVLARLPRLVDWLERAVPDVVCLQETKVGADAFPADAVTPLGYAAAHHGDGRWNGVAVLSRVGLDDVVTYWDYRAGAFHKGMGMRIDLIYANAALAGSVSDAWWTARPAKARDRATTPR